LRIIDNFIADPKVLRAIDLSPFWEDQSYYWKGFAWRQRYKDLTNDAWEKSIGGCIVNLMMQDSQLLEEYPFYSAAGFEYWPTVLMAGMDLQDEEDGTYSLNIHTDFDIVAYKKTGKLTHPLFGAVMYFGNEDVEGGLLKVWEENDDTYHTIEPKNNRLVVFNSHRPHGVTEVTKGIRKSIAINFWREKIMLPDSKELGEQF